MNLPGARACPERVIVRDNSKRARRLRPCGADAPCAAQRIGTVMKFTPALNRDQKVKVWIQLPVVFKTQ